MKRKELDAPLVREPEATKPRRLNVAPVLVSASLVLAVVAAFWVAVVDDPDGGRSVAVAKIQDAAPAATGSLAVDAADEPDFGPPTDASETDLAALPVAPDAGSALPGLIEPSAFGPLPRVSPDGRRPREAYAARAPAAAPDEPRIVMVVGGMGMSQTGTQAAIEALPEAVTLAFASYGSSLQRWADKARAEGHEVLLQVPLEPEGYPARNPGEHTLLVSPDRHQMRQELHWNLGRMTAYAGVMNYMGGRFTASDEAMLPFLGEIGERGLFFLDDGVSQQSRASGVGEAMRVPVVTADIVVDRARSAAAIESELRRLEGIAFDRGIAIGVASAFPTTVEAIAEWASDAEARGFAIVPATAALN
jgi:polysaccharide deacetylase 2 family uncharacterized protein YibQ